MIQILTSDSYRGFSAPLHDRAGQAEDGAQPIYVGRMVWPGKEEAEDAVIKLYRADTCGTANEAIGYIANGLRGVDQPKRGAILLLPGTTLPPLNCDLIPFVDQKDGMAVCWATSLEQDVKPFKFIRRLSSFTEKQAQAFYKSRFCQVLAGVDHVTGNNDRHEGNFLYKDDLHCLAIDQGNIGGGVFWHTLWPDENARNEILLLVQQNLTPSQLTVWQSNAIIEYHATEGIWNDFSEQVSDSLVGLLTAEQIATIITYMTARIHSSKFATQCGVLL